MSCLRIKLWKSFIAKFHKLRRSKTQPQIGYGASTSVNRFVCSSHQSVKNLQDRDSRVLHIRLKRGCLFKKKRKSVVYVDKLLREPIAATNWKEDLSPEKGIDERAQEFINRMKAEMFSARNL